MLEECLYSSPCTLRARRRPVSGQGYARGSRLALIFATDARGLKAVGLVAARKRWYAR
jgi:hypothetical protein